MRKLLIAGCVAMAVIAGACAVWPERLAVVAWVPALRLIGDVAKMAGYPVGLWWRLTHRHLIPPGHPRR